MSETAGWLLDGRLRYRQLATGHRTGIEPVLLAASIPARDGETVIEAGTGAGAGLLCLAARLPGISGLGVERETRLAALAQRNFAANDLPNLTAIAADLAALPLQRRFDHGFANPPWRSPHDTPSPDTIRRRAHHSTAGLLATWAQAIAALLKPRGTMTFILPATSLDECLGAMKQAGCGAPRIMPLWPRTDRAAKLVIVRSTKGDRGSLTLLPGLTLHDDTGYTPRAEAILRGGESLTF